jgi:hypothetical protein
MTWTRRKHSDLLRLLAEFAREHPDGTEEWWEQFRGVQSGITAERPGPKDEVIPLGWWCQFVKIYCGVEAHRALRWLVMQYDDRESNKESLFCERFGRGSADSIARRLYLKIKEKSESGEHLPLKLNGEFYAAVRARRDATAHLRWHEIVTVDEYLAGYKPPPLPPWDWEADLHHFTI